MKQVIYSISGLLLLLAACSESQQQGEGSSAEDTAKTNRSEQASEITQEETISAQAPKAVKSWETDKNLKVPESVLYDKENNVYYISNVAGKPDKKDGKGFISKMDTSGKITNLKWIDGLNAPKGMGIHNGMLYVSDIDQVVKIDIANNKIAKKYKAKEARFLNDITTDSKGTVYISDWNAKSVYSLKNDKLKKWLTHDSLNKVNGLYFEKGSLLAGTSKQILKIDPSSKKVKPFITNTGQIDGLQATKQDGYLISDWHGKVHWVHPEKDKVKLIDTKDKEINAADIEFVSSESLLLVPTFSDNRVMSYKVKGLQSKAVQ